jgi:hypothetical protein
MVMEELLTVIVAGGVTPDKNTLSQLLSALRSVGVFLTPPQFDNTTKAATTAFVKDAIGSFSGHSVVGTTTLTVANIGEVVVCTGPATITLPAAAACTAGSSIRFFATGSSVIVQRAGSDTIQPNGSTVTSIALNSGDTLVLDSNGTSNWTAVGGSAQLGFSNVFSASKAGNGYMKLPNGLIFQWGQGLFSAVAGNVQTPSLAIAYPNVHLLAWATNASSTGAGGSAQPPSVGAVALSVTQVQVQQHTNVAYGTYYNYLSIGY